MDASTILDGAILLWLVGTWFYEGHHRRCTVVAECPKCGGAHDVECVAGHDHAHPLPPPDPALSTKFK